MKDYKIVINIYDAESVYNANNMEEAKEIAQLECDDIYNRLNGRCDVRVKSIEQAEMKW